MNSNGDNEDNNKNKRGISVKDLRDCLTTISFTLNFFRNYYSHTRHVENRSENIITASRESEKLTGIYLKEVCTVATRSVKRRFSDKNNKGQAGMIDDKSLKFITEQKGRVSTIDGENQFVSNPDYFLNPLVLVAVPTDR